ncbi:MAG: hypothetical protein ABSE49_29180 [Polyangiaceae bacterium]|jgi:hypothetical protein
MVRRAIALPAALAAMVFTTAANAGPETSLRNFASETVESGVRSVGMGGDGATTGNYALVLRDPETASIAAGVARYEDTANAMSFVATSFTTPLFWGGAALSVTGVSQYASSIRVWDDTAPTPLAPPSLGDGSSQAAQVVLAKPLWPGVSLGLMLSYAQSQMTLLPLSGTPAIRYSTSWLPSGGAGLHWRPDERWELGARITVVNDEETRDDASGLRSGLVRAYDARLGGGWSPWRGTRLDAGFVVRQEASDVDAALRLPSTSLKVFPTVGVEQTLVRRRVWVRAGLDERTWTTGLSLRARPLTIDVAYVYGIALSRIDELFGQRNASLLASLRVDL